jgi:hypothetical protein
MGCMKWNTEFRLWALFILIGAVMAHAAHVEAAPSQSVYLIEMEFRLHGTLLAAGRDPVYGMEARNIERPSGSPAAKPEVYLLSPLPIRYPAVAQTDDFPFDLFPFVPAEPCTLNVTLKLTDSPKTMAVWLGQGLPASWLRAKAGDGEAEIRAWTGDLAGPRPKDFTVTVERWGDGKAQAELGTYHLTPDQPVRFDLALPGLSPVSAASEKNAGDKYLFEMPGLRFWWQRQPPRPSDAVWPRGKPAEAVGPGQAAAMGTQTATQIPAPVKPIAKKRPFWKFWQRAD